MGGEAGWVAVRRSPKGTGQAHKTRREAGEAGREAAAQVNAGGRAGA